MRRFVLVLAMCAGACGSSSGGGPADANPPDAPFSVCGHPGDVGNEIGVGKYCVVSSDCADTSGAELCATLSGEPTYFCTSICDPTMPIEPQCGTGTMCVCQGSCGCTPNECVAP